LFTLDSLMQGCAKIISDFMVNHRPFKLLVYDKPIILYKPTLVNTHHKVSKKLTYKYVLDLKVNICHTSIIM